LPIQQNNLPRYIQIAAKFVFWGGEELGQTTMVGHRRSLSTRPVLLNRDTYLSPNSWKRAGCPRVSSGEFGVNNKMVPRWGLKAISRWQARGVSACSFQRGTVPSLCSFCNIAQ